jgi:hypothetical protein
MFTYNEITFYSRHHKPNGQVRFLSRTAPLNHPPEVSLLQAAITRKIKAENTTENRLLIGNRGTVISMKYADIKRH